MIGDVRLARPKDFFNLLQLKPELFSFFTDATNLWAAADGAGSGRGTYYDFVPFYVVEIYKLVGILIANGLTPKPRLEYWFQTTHDQPLFGSDLVTKVTEKRGRVSDRTIRGLHRWRHFCRFFTMVDCHNCPKAKQKADPLWKVRVLIDQLNKQEAGKGHVKKGFAYSLQTAKQVQNYQVHYL